jgi:hypothetical protein
MLGTSARRQLQSESSPPALNIVRWAPRGNNVLCHLDREFMTAMLSEFLFGPLSIVLAVASFFFIVWPGYAVLHVLGFGWHRWRWAPFAGPAVTLALWIISLSATVWAKFTLQQTAIPFWTATLVLTVLGLSLGASCWRKGKAAGKARDPWLWLVVGATVAIPLLVMPASVRFGLANFANSTSADSWSYVAMADYLLTLPRGVEGGLSALHQYAAHLMATRNAAPAIIGFLAIGLGGIKVNQTVVLFCLIILFANAAALVAFAATVFGRAAAAVALLVVAALGWPANIVLVGNFDQLLLLPLLPTIAALAFLGGKGIATGRAGIVIGVLASAAFYAYVELSVLGLLVAMSLIAVPNVSTRSLIGRAPLICCLAVPIAIILSWPASDALLAFLKHQYSDTSAAVRPGEGYFPGLVSQFDWFGGMWALGPEHPLGHAFSIANAIGAALLLVTVAGVWSERKRWSTVLGFAVVAVAFVYCAYFQHYSYAAYKTISVNFWLLGFFTVAGFLWLAAFLSDNRSSRRGITIAAIAGLLAITGFRIAVANEVTHFTRNAIQQEHFQEIQTVADMIGKEPTLLAVRDPLANEWAVFYLADTPMLIVPYRRYMAQPHVIPLMSRAKAVSPAAIRYIVTDRNDPVRSRVVGARPIWEGQAYVIWLIDRPDWAVIADFNSPNGIEEDGRNSWVWLGGPEVEFIIVAGRAGVAELTGMFYQSPQAPQGIEGIRVSLTDASGRHEIKIRQVANRLPINLSLGMTTVTIKVEDKANPAVPAGKDPRALMLRLTDLMIQY